jgi:hypothetical protein
MSGTRYCCQIVMKLEFSGQVFEEYSNMKFIGNPSSESRVVPCGRRTDMTKLIVAFRNFAIAPIIDQKQLTHEPRTICITILIIFQQSGSSVTLY